MKNNIAYALKGLALSESELLMVWGHGWGHDRHAFDNFISPLECRASHILLDFPGFGESPKPPDSWTTADYADAVSQLISPLKQNKKLIWVGHSFGGRIGVQLAARHPDFVDGLFIIAGAGLPKKRGFWGAVRYKSRLVFYKTAKQILTILGFSVDALREKFSSADYKNAGGMRQIFLNTIRENLSDVAKTIKCPTCLVYGADDAEAPPDIGQRFAKLIPDASFSLLPNQDHYSLLQSGCHLVLKRLTVFMDKVR